MKHNFFDKDIVQLILDLANEGKRVIVSTLDRDFIGKPFRFAGDILAIADNIDKKAAICFVCGNAATITFRKGTSTN